MVEILSWTMLGFICGIVAGLWAGKAIYGGFDG